MSQSGDQLDEVIRDHQMPELLLRRRGEASRVFFAEAAASLRSFSASILRTLAAASCRAGFGSPSLRAGKSSNTLLGANRFGVSISADIAKAHTPQFSAQCRKDRRWQIDAGDIGDDPPHVKQTVRDVVELVKHLRLGEFAFIDYELKYGVSGRRVAVDVVKSRHRGHQRVEAVSRLLERTRFTHA